ARAVRRSDPVGLGRRHAVPDPRGRNSEARLPVQPLDEQKDPLEAAHPGRPRRPRPNRERPCHARRRPLRLLVQPRDELGSLRRHGLEIEETRRMALERALKTRDIVLFNVAAIVGMRWIALAAASGPSSLFLWVLAAVAFFIP